MSLIMSGNSVSANKDDHQPPAGTRFKRSYKRGDTPVPSSRSRREDTPVPSPCEQVSSRSSRSTRRRTCYKEINRRVRKSRVPNLLDLSPALRKQLMENGCSPRKIYTNIEEWASYYIEKFKHDKKKQSPYSMFNRAIRETFKASKIPSKAPVDLWFKLPESIRWEWTELVGIAKAVSEEGLIGWQLDDRRLVENFRKKCESKAFRPYPSTHKVGTFPVEYIPRVEFKRILQHRLPPLPLLPAIDVIPEILSLPPVRELLDSVPTADQKPTQGPRPGSPAKKPYDEYHYSPRSHLDILGGLSYEPK